MPIAPGFLFFTAGLVFWLRVVIVLRLRSERPPAVCTEVVQLQFCPCGRDVVNGGGFSSYDRFSQSTGGSLQISCNLPLDI